MIIPTKYMVPAALVAVILIGGGVYVATHKTVKNKVAQDVNSTPAPTPATSVSFAGVEGKTAIETLKSQHNVETKKISSGDMVTSIDGLTADDHKNWVFYVNGVPATEGADVYKAKKGDLLAFRYE